jgi:hypothetical protein
LSHNYQYPEPSKKADEKSLLPCCFLERITYEIRMKYGWDAYLIRIYTANPARLYMRMLFMLP